uniref:Ig-like domain-containing protein n=1 Tax=Esox lucius TaxID=8010 RepID=A0AAY5K8D9_ESOLU
MTAVEAWKGIFREDAQRLVRSMGWLTSGSYSIQKIHNGILNILDVLDFYICSSVPKPLVSVVILHWEANMYTNIIKANNLTCDLLGIVSNLTFRIIVPKDERPMVHRVGSWVDAKSLLQGNASLHLLNVSVADEGVYCCRVIITPNTYKVSTRLEVSAKPVISLPEAVTVMEGEKRTLMCEITGFYPEQLTVTWLIQNGSQLSRGVCTGMATPNPDGTYSVSSLITIKLVMAVEDERAVYTCRVYHSSFPLQCTLNLCVKDFCPEQVSITWFKNGKVIPAGPVFNSPPSLNINGLYSMWTFFRLTPAPEDSCTEIRCRVVHSAQTKPEERVFTLSDMKA